MKSAGQWVDAIDRTSDGRGKDVLDLRPVEVVELLVRVQEDARRPLLELLDRCRRTGALRTDVNAGGALYRDVCAALGRGPQ